VGFWRRFFGGRSEEEEKRVAESADAARALLSAGDPAGAFVALRPALIADPDFPAHLKQASDLCTRLGDPELAELFASAADASEDVQRAFELGSQLLSLEDAELAAAILSKATELAPFDAVLRSETAIAFARAGRPQDVVETLALHPNLADDPGALFEFAWASLLVGDTRAARGSRSQLATLNAAKRLLDKLDAALLRAEVATAEEPPDARDYYFLEHGGLLIDAAGEGRGRYGEVDLDGARVGRIIRDLGAALTALWPKPRRIMAGSTRDRVLAAAIAEEVGGELIDTGQGRKPSGLLVVRDAAALERLDPRIYLDTSDVLTFALMLRWDAGLSRAPDFVGVMARRAAQSDATIEPSREAEDAQLSSFVEGRRGYLPPSGRHVHTAYLPDAPLPRP